MFVAVVGVLVGILVGYATSRDPAVAFIFASDTDKMLAYSVAFVKRGGSCSAVSPCVGYGRYAQKNQSEAPEHGFRLKGLVRQTFPHAFCLEKRLFFKNTLLPTSFP